MVMQISNQTVIDAFRQSDIRATPQRISVYRFLKENPIHPSADTIYNELVKEYPSFSRTTVYNSLSALVEAGLVITVRLDDRELRYDGNPDYHGHFKCLECGAICDFYPGSISFDGLHGCEIYSKDVYFTGICQSCNRKKVN